MNARAQAPAERGSRFDAVVIGGGHNGLACAAYLAGARLKVCVLERRSVLGGAAVTEESHPGCRNSTASYTVSLLNPKVIRDLKLVEHGLSIVSRPFSNFLPLADGGWEVAPVQLRLDLVRDELLVHQEPGARLDLTVLLAHRIRHGRQPAFGCV